MLGDDRSAELMRAAIIILALLLAIALVAHNHDDARSGHAAAADRPAEVCG